MIHEPFGRSSRLFVRPGHENQSTSGLLWIFLDSIRSQWYLMPEVAGIQTCSLESPL